MASKVQLGRAAAAVAVIISIASIDAWASRAPVSAGDTGNRVVVTCGSYVDPYLITVADSVPGRMALMRGAPGVGFYRGVFIGEVIFVVGSRVERPSVTAWRTGGRRVFVKTLFNTTGPPTVHLVDGLVIVAYEEHSEGSSVRPGPDASGEAAESRSTSAPAAVMSHEPAIATLEVFAGAAAGGQGHSSSTAVTASLVRPREPAEIRPAARDPRAHEGVRPAARHSYAGLDAPAWSYTRLRVIRSDYGTGGADATSINAMWARQKARIPEPPVNGANPWRISADRSLRKLVEVSPGGSMPRHRSADAVIRTTLGGRRIIDQHALGRDIVRDFRGIAFQVKAYDVQTTALPGIMRPAYQLPAISTLVYQPLYYSSWR